MFRSFVTGKMFWLHSTTGHIQPSLVCILNVCYTNWLLTVHLVAVCLMVVALIHTLIQVQNLCVYYTKVMGNSTMPYSVFISFSGLTGIFLTLVVIIMYVFASPFGRRYAFSAFWFTHGFYILLYILMIMHGLGRLVQPPLTHTFVIGPLVIFTIDKLISLSRNKIECRVVKAELLPSGIDNNVFVAWC